jgi:hypothetical protein
MAKERHNVEKDIDHEENSKGDSSLDNSSKDSDKKDVNIKGSKRIRVD